MEILKKLRLLRYLLKRHRDITQEELKVFTQEYYGIEQLPIEFYRLLEYNLSQKRLKKTIDIIIKEDIYKLISYLKYNGELTDNLEEYITPYRYFEIPKHSINKIIQALKKLPKEENILFHNTKKAALWLLKRNPTETPAEYIEIAYKLYQVIGFENTMELLNEKYGKITYEQIHFMIKNLKTKQDINEEEKEAFIKFLFSNKKNDNNIIRQMLNGNFNELFLNFDYFYNKLSNFVKTIGTKFTKQKIRELMKDRFVSYNVSSPEITNELLDDMLSSYYCRYESLDTPKDEVYCRNYEAYDKYLKNKYQSSIPQIESIKEDDITAEILNLNDPRNLVLGYRSGNCFRINGDANILFNNFLKSEHMRLISLSTSEYKDFAMMLVMRNGNVLIGQGIEISKRIPAEFDNKRIYDICRKILKEMMNYANDNDDEIVATIIGCSNSNVSNYNNQFLPFLVSPILENSSPFYNGIYNYQCLLDIMLGKTLYDIKTYIPTARYLDKRERTFIRDYSQINYDEYLEMEKRLRALRFSRFQLERDTSFYTKIERHPVYTACNREWYITLYDDDTIDSYILCQDDPRIGEEYKCEMNKVYKRIKKQKQS